ncbi:MAG: ester cyclase, partial [Gammaproteobacteria bacterium]
SKAEQIIRAAQLFYTFWNTGDTIYLDAVIAPDFKDNTLPEGRPQGPEGLKAASKNFRTAVPDLSCSVEDLLVVGDKVTARLIFRGTFEGEFMDHAPTNEPVEFIAIDILHIKNGRLIEDWHLEDNLTLMKQLHAVQQIQ